jgi:hypothetical protein
MPKFWKAVSTMKGKKKDSNVDFKHLESIKKHFKNLFYENLNPGAFQKEKADDVNRYEKETNKLCL